jgi:thiamine-phosphate pyrophosphorylase
MISPSELAEALRVIVITDAGFAAPRTVEEVVEEVLRAGARTIQLREKNASARVLFEEALRLRRLTRKWEALFFVNDRFDVALAAEADGVHVGPHDLPVADLRAVAPAGFLIGHSAADPLVARQSEADGADYIGCGPVFPTGTKTDAGEVMGVEGLHRVVSSVAIPVVGIGGIDAQGAWRIARSTGAAGVAVVSAVMAAGKPGEAFQRLLEPFGVARDGEHPSPLR